MTEPNWLTIARGEIGVKQWAGSSDNPRVMEYLACCGFYPAHDEGLEWCGCFVTWVMVQNGNRIIGDEPVDRMAAAYPPWWRYFGDSIAAPVVGAIAVKKSGLHVAFVEKITGSTMNLLGGNQDDEVKIWTGKRVSDYTFRMPG